MVKIFGLTNLLLIIFMVLPFLLRKINPALPGTTKNFVKPFNVWIRKRHYLAGLLLLISIIVHGSSTSVGLRLHTGPIAASAVFLTAACGLIFFLIKKPAYLRIHRFLVLAIVAAVSLHLAVPKLF